MGVGRRVRCCWGRRAAAPGLKREVTINLLLGGACGKVQGGGGHAVLASATASAMAASGNNVPHASRSPASAFFARMGVVVWR
jgi:hypothetical protein